MPEDDQPILPLKFSGPVTHRLSDTDEARRLRAMLDAVRKSDGVLIGLSEFAWGDDGFHMIVCTPGDEVALGKTMAEALTGWDAAMGLWMQAARKVLKKHDLGDEWLKEVNRLARGIDRQRKRKDDDT